MKIQIASDIHTEFHRRDQGRKLLQRIAGDTSSEADVLLVLGDLSTSNGLRYAFSILCNEFRNVIYVTGNHEYYGCTRDEVEDLICEISNKHNNLHWLNRETVEIDGQRFIGCTLWFPPTDFVIKNSMYTNDMRMIQSEHGKPHWVLGEFEKNHKYLKNNVQSDDIVLTHYIPCKEGIHEQYKDYNNDFFMGDVSDVILENKPKLWTFGHTHSHMNFKLGETRLICNPCGYPHEAEYDKFYDSLIVEI